MANVNLDPNYLKDQVLTSAKKSGRTLSDAEVQQWVGYASTPTEYSDHQWRVGWNPYWESRMQPGHEAASNPALAGTEGIVAPPPGASRPQRPQAQGLGQMAGYQQALQQLLARQMQQPPAPSAAAIPNVASMLKMFAKPPTAQRQPWQGAPQAQGQSQSPSVSLADQIAADAIRRALGGV